MGFGDFAEGRWWLPEGSRGRRPVRAAAWQSACSPLFQQLREQFQVLAMLPQIGPHRAEPFLVELDFLGSFVETAGSGPVSGYFCECVHQKPKTGSAPGETPGTRVPSPRQVRSRLGLLVPFCRVRSRVWVSCFVTND